MKLTSRLIFTSILFVLSSVVAGLNGFDGDPQPFVIIYWVVLSIRYIVEIVVVVGHNIAKKEDGLNGL